MNKAFRIVAFLEGASYILLLFIAVPIKYWGGDDQWVKLLGMPHGVLFVGYIMMAILLKGEQNWSSVEFVIILICSILPFGTFYVDKKFLKN